MDNAIPIVMLIVSIVTSDGKPNIRHQVPMPSVQVCLQEAERFLNHELPDFVDAQGLSANCIKRPVKDWRS